MKESDINSETKILSNFINTFHCLLVENVQCLNWFGLDWIGLDWMPCWKGDSGNSQVEYQPLKISDDVKVKKEEIRASRRSIVLTKS
jgi:hypothetical protein